MARRKFGATGADQVIDGQGNYVPFAVGSAFTAQTGGSAVTDLTKYDGTPITVITADATGLPEWYGPNDGTAQLWVDWGFGRKLHRAIDTEDRVAALEASTANELTASQFGVVPGGVPGPLDSSGFLPINQLPVGVLGGAATTDSSGRVPETQTNLGVPYVIQYGVPTASAWRTRVDLLGNPLAASRCVIWKGPTDPTFNAGYALAGVDIWIQET